MPGTVARVSVHPLTYRRADVVCDPAALQGCLNSLRWAARELSYPDHRERAAAIVAAAPAGDAKALHRHLIAAGKDQQNRWACGDLLRSATRAVRTHSGMWAERRCTCVQAAAAVFVRQVDALLAECTAVGDASANLWAVSLVGRPGQPERVLPDWELSLGLHQVLGQYASSLQVLDCLTVAVEVDTDAATITFRRRSTDPAHTLRFARICAADRRQVAWRAKAGCDDARHGSHVSTASLVRDWPQSWVEVAAAACRRRQIRWPDCPHGWPLALARLGAVTAEMTLFVEHTAPQWPGTFAELLEMARTVARPAA